MAKYNTPQELFDAVYNGLAKQNFARAFDTDLEMCRYRADTGLKCAIGNLIPDENYKDTLEGKCGSEDTVMNAAGITHELGDYANSLQEIHDCYEDAAMMKDMFHKYASDYNLTVPEIAG